MEALRGCKIGAFQSTVFTLRVGLGQHTAPLSGITLYTQISVQRERVGECDPPQPHQPLLPQLHKSHRGALVQKVNKLWEIGEIRGLSQVVSDSCRSSSKPKLLSPTSSLSPPNHFPPLGCWVCDVLTFIGFR